MYSLLSEAAYAVVLQYSKLRGGVSSTILWLLHVPNFSFFSIAHNSRTTHGTYKPSTQYTIP